MVCKHVDKNRGKSTQVRGEAVAVLAHVRVHVGQRVHLAVQTRTGAQRIRPMVRDCPLDEISDHCTGEQAAAILHVAAPCDSSVVGEAAVGKKVHRNGALMSERGCIRDREIFLEKNIEAQRIPSFDGLLLCE